MWPNGLFIMMYGDLYKKLNELIDGLVDERNVLSNMKLISEYFEEMVKNIDSNEKKFLIRSYVKKSVDEGKRIIYLKGRSNNLILSYVLDYEKTLDENVNIILKKYLYEKFYENLTDVKSLLYMLEEDRSFELIFSDSIKEEIAEMRDILKFYRVTDDFPVKTKKSKEKKSEKRHDSKDSNQNTPGVVVVPGNTQPMPLIPAIDLATGRIVYVPAGYTKDPATGRPVVPL